MDANKKERHNFFVSLFGSSFRLWIKNHLIVMFPLVVTGFEWSCRTDACVILSFHYVYFILASRTEKHQDCLSFFRFSSSFNSCATLLACSVVLSTLTGIRCIYLYLSYRHVICLFIHLYSVALNKWVREWVNECEWL